MISTILYIWYLTILQYISLYLWVTDLFSLSLSSAISLSRFSFSILSSSILSWSELYELGVRLCATLMPGEMPGAPLASRLSLLRSRSSFSAVLRSRSSRFRASLLSGTGLHNSTSLLLCQWKIWYLCPVFRIRIHLILIRIQHFRLNTDPDPGLWWPKLEKIYCWKKNKIVFGSKTARLHKGFPSYRRSFQPSKEHEHPALQNMQFLNFFYFC